jgi:tetratricopeptide (TPR) repeat protein
METTVAAAIRGEAARAALHGDRRIALAWLEQVPGEPPDSQTSILRARILSQLGELDQAIQHWRAAAAADPGNLDAQRGLAAAERLRGSVFGRLRLYARRAGVVVTAVILVGGGLWAVGGNRGAAAAQTARAIAELERTRAAGQQAAERRHEESLRQLREVMQARDAQLQEVVAAERRSRVEVQEQLRRLTRRTSDLIARIDGLTRPRPAGPPSP